MRLPVLFNSNQQIQDADGELVCEMWRNPRAVEDGKRLVELLNASVPPVEKVPEVLIEPLINHIKKLSQSERMKAYWAQKRNLVKA